MADDDIVTLQSNDGQEFQITVRAAKMSGTFKSVIEDKGISEPIPSDSLSGEILSKVVEYCIYHDANSATDNDSSWDIDFCGVDKETLFELIFAANYLHNQELLDLTCKTVANMLKGKNEEETLKEFDIKEGFTKEEKEQVIKENSWCKIKNN